MRQADRHQRELEAASYDTGCGAQLRGEGPRVLVGQGRVMAALDTRAALAIELAELGKLGKLLRNPPRQRAGLGLASSSGMPKSMIASMRPRTREAVSGIRAQIGDSTLRTIGPSI